MGYRRVRHIQQEAGARQIRTGTGAGQRQSIPHSVQTPGNAAGRNITGRATPKTKIRHGRQSLKNLGKNIVIHSDIY